MKAWFDALDARERQWLIIGTAVLLVLLLYVGAWEPMQKSVADLRAANAEQRSLLSWMQTAAREVGQLRANERTPAQMASGQSLISLVDRSARATRLGPALKRVQPDGSRRVSVWLEAASFDDVMAWLASLETSGVTVVSAVFEAKGESTGQGRSDVRLVLEVAA